MKEVSWRKHYLITALPSAGQTHQTHRDARGTAPHASSHHRGARAPAAEAGRAWARRDDVSVDQGRGDLLGRRRRVLPPGGADDEAAAAGREPGGGQMVRLCVRRARQL